MQYIPNTNENRAEMLKKIGVKDFSRLLSCIPQSAVLKNDLKLPPPLSELELTQLLKDISELNRSADQMISFLGGGAYDHFIPSLIGHITQRSEFYTAYTPYQPECSQGWLQSIYEYQTVICQLTGMDVSNASLYDGGTALYEACMMAIRITGRNKIVMEETGTIRNPLSWFEQTGLNIFSWFNDPIDLSLSGRYIVKSGWDDSDVLLATNGRVVDENTYATLLNGKMPLAIGGDTQWRRDEPLSLEDLSERDSMQVIVWPSAARMFYWKFSGPAFNKDWQSLAPEFTDLLEASKKKTAKPENNNN